MAKLTEEQVAKVKSWAEEGANLNEIQQRLQEDLAITMTYLDVRLMLVDLGVTLVDRKPKPVAEPAPEVVSGDGEGPSAGETEALPAAGAGQVSVTVDKIAIPTMLVSGKVTFSDGQAASWYVDQMGRLGLKGPDAGYRPPAADVPVFQRRLDELLMKQGY